MASRSRARGTDVQSFEWIDATSVEQAAALLAGRRQRTRRRQGRRHRPRRSHEGGHRPPRAGGQSADDSLVSTASASDRRGELRLGALVTLAQIANRRTCWRAVPRWRRRRATPRRRRCGTPRRSAATCCSGRAAGTTARAFPSGRSRAGPGSDQRRASISRHLRQHDVGDGARVDAGDGAGRLSTPASK